MTFQKNAWCDERVMKDYIVQQWNPAGDGQMLLVLDEHKAQTTDDIRNCLRVQFNTEQVVVPAGTTYLVQPVDVVFDHPFKAIVEKEATQHLQENLSSYVTGQINTGECQMLITQWVAKAWNNVSSNCDLVIHSFSKCGFSVAIDGSEDEDINIERLDEYSVGSDNSDSEATDEESDEEDPFAHLDEV